jgi:fumarylpyruvate hydrolase
MVVALDQGGSDLSPDETAALIFGYGVGLDMTRRDLQAVSKEKRRPWDTSKDVENSAILGALTAKDAVALGEAAITLKVNGETRQDAPLTDMVWSVGEILSHLSRLYTLRPGDIVLTGTPAGVAAVSRGDHLSARVTGLAPLDVTLR